MKLFPPFYSILLDIPDKEQFSHALNRLISDKQLISGRNYTGEIKSNHFYITRNNIYYIWVFPIIRGRFINKDQVRLDIVSHRLVLYLLCGYLLFLICIGLVFNWPSFPFAILIPFSFLYLIFLLFYLVGYIQAIKDVELIKRLV